MELDQSLAPLAAAFPGGGCYLENRDRSHSWLATPDNKARTLRLAHAHTSRTYLHIKYTQPLVARRA